MGEGAGSPDNGGVKVEIYSAASSFGEVTKQATQVKDGTIDIALGLRGAEGDRFLRSSIVELPFVVHDALGGSRALSGVLPGWCAGRWVRTTRSSLCSYTIPV